MFRQLLENLPTTGDPGAGNFPVGFQVVGNSQRQICGKQQDFLNKVPAKDGAFAKSGERKKPPVQDGNCQESNQGSRKKPIIVNWEGGIDALPDGDPCVKEPASDVVEGRPDEQSCQQGDETSQENVQIMAVQSSTESFWGRVHAGYRTVPRYPSGSSSASAYPASSAARIICSLI